ncbi:MAG: hypothetical protein IJ751_10415, partial [Oscillospiraceae bacterium]|nr:hypothetical protein [Oscillospiraceae bacterium]
GQYPMRWAPAAAEEHSPAEETSARLLELGFPADVLEDMSPEDVSACEGALRVVAERSASSDLPELRITTIAVELPGTESRWRIIHHFVWASNPDFFGTEAIRLTPAPQNDDAWTMEGEVTGRLLCDRDGATEAAPCFTLGTETVTADSIFWGEQTTTSTWATFSLPGDAQRPRGYLAYTARDASGQSSFLGSWISYTHQCSRLRYPAITAQEALQSGIGGSGGGFATVWASLQLDPRPDNAKSMD